MDTVPSRDRDWTNLAYIDRSSMRCSAAASTSMEVLFLSMDYPGPALVPEGGGFPDLGIAFARARARHIRVGARAWIFAISRR